MSSENTIIIDDNSLAWDIESLLNIIIIKTYFGPTDLSNKYLQDNELLNVDKYIDIILNYAKYATKINFMSIIDLCNHKEKYTLEKMVEKCNKKYNEESWIYDKYYFSTISYYINDSNYDQLTQPLFNPILFEDRDFNSYII